jgi:hypothetical protein
MACEKFYRAAKIEEANRAFQLDGPHLPIKLADVGHPIRVRFDQMWATRPLHQTWVDGLNKYKHRRI